MRDGVIQEVLPTRDAAARFGDYEHLDLADRILIPGLVNAHTQAARSLLRGLSDERKAAAEKRWLSADFVRDGTAFACSEMLRSGITCFSDRYYFPEAAAEAALESGMRVALGLLVSDVPTPYASDPADYLRKGLATRDRYGDESSISFTFAPQALPDASYKQIATLAAELDLPVQVHIDGEMDRLTRLGLLGPGLIGVHPLELRPDEAQLLARHGSSIVLCPSSSPATPGSGINLALGTGADRFDLFAEMRTRGLPLHAATLSGARALGLAAHIGSVQPGKRADLTALAVRGPCHDPLAHVMRVAGREDVTHVWVNGELRVRDGALENAARRLDTRWQMWQNFLESRADS